MDRRSKTASCCYDVLRHHTSSVAYGLRGASHAHSTRPRILHTRETHQWTLSYSIYRIIWATTNSRWNFLRSQFAIFTSFSAFFPMYSFRLCSQASCCFLFLLVCCFCALSFFCILIQIIVLNKQSISSTHTHTETSFGPQFSLMLSWNEKREDEKNQHAGPLVKVSFNGRIPIAYKKYETYISV